MKSKKQLLKIWEQVQFEYYNNLDFAELSKEYISWFADKPESFLVDADNEYSRDELISALMESEYDCRIDDDIHELDKLIEKIEMINFNQNSKLNNIQDIDNTTNEIMDQIRDIFDEIDLTHYINNNTDYDIDDLDDRFYTIIHNKLKQIK
jgi:predicted transcriptional regulator|tara:strand:- start:295 stop:747 length:453 start_codon:yes stop_codon:yes gene_type:complete